MAIVLAWLVGLGRALTGVWFLTRPASAASGWQGSVSKPIVSLVKSVGGRDAVIGGGVLWALISDSAVVPWLVASVVADVVDLALGFVDLEGKLRRRTVSLAGGFGLLGAVAIITNL